MTLVYRDKILWRGKGVPLERGRQKGLPHFKNIILPLLAVEECYRIDSDFVVWDPRIQRIQLEWGRNVLRSSTLLFLNVGPPNFGTL